MSATSHMVNHEVQFQSAEEQRRVGLWLIGAFLGGILIINSYLARNTLMTPDVAGLSAFLGALLLGVPIVYRAVRDLLSGERSMNELVALAIVACFAREEYETAGLVAFFMLLADLIQARTALGARESIERLLRLAPTTARLIRGDGTEEEVEAWKLKPGQAIRLRPGDNVAADGKIVKGETSINEATVTGEAVPSDKGVGSPVFAGTVNITGAVEVEVSKVGDDTTLGRVRHLILDAEQTKIPLMRLIDEYIQWYTPVVLMVAIIIWVFTRRPENAIAALIATCPCAFILATPTAMVAALSSAARLGILVKNVRDLESAGSLNAMVFDKTGTLTTGRLAVTRLAPVDGVEPAEMLGVAASCELHSNHPVAQAVVAIAREARLPLAEPEGLKEASGKGVEAKVKGHDVRVGRAAWIEENGIDVSGLHIDGAQTESYSILYVARDGKAIGWIGLEDKPRVEAKRAFIDLRNLGLRRLVMLTGDRWSVARKMAAELGCNEVEAECLPEQKLDLVRRMQDEGYRVAVVGDGVNDAPALAAGDIGIAMGAAGSDVAINSATIALMSEDLRRLPFLVSLSRRSRRIVNQNLLFGLCFIIGALTLAGSGNLTAINAAIMHNVGSFIVIFNSARLVRYGEEIETHTPADA